MKIGQKVMVNPDNDNENYNSFKNKVLIITHIARNVKEHQGYDESISPQKLYDLKEAKTGKIIDCSLYDYELIQI